MIKFISKSLAVAALILLTSGCSTLNAVAGTAISAAVGYGIYAATHH